MIKISRKEAMAAGVTRYYTGKPCPRGHISERIVSIRACVACLREKKRDWSENNPEKVNEQKRQWRNANLDKARALNLVNQKKHREKANERNRRYAATHREQLREKNAKWAKENPASLSARQARRRSRKLCATPAWADHGKIDRAYEMVAEYRSKGINAHVDHIVPLQGRMVCGLHVHYNLQIIDGKYNLSKSNKF